MLERHQQDQMVERVDQTEEVWWVEEDLSEGPPPQGEIQIKPDQVIPDAL